MAGQKLSPRQKMIGMMYLVLTALLALNVSKEIINAFVTINDSLEVTVNNLNGKNNQAYDAFEKQMQNDAAKTKPFYDKAKVVKSECEKLEGFVASLKDTLIRVTDKIESGAKTVPLREMKKQDDYDEPTRIMCGDKQDGRGFKATELKSRIETFKKNVIATLDPGDRDKFTKRLDELFNTTDPKGGDLEGSKKSWEMANFYHNPVVATVALLSKIQTDVKNAESEIVTHLLSAISASDFKFDTLAPKVIAPSSYVIEGQEYSADIFLAAMSSTSNPDITVGGSALTVSGGVGTYKVRASGIGEKKYAGVIKVKDPGNANKMLEFPFENSYIVAKPSASVAADKMNVIYMGVPNPITVSVPGVPDEKVRVVASGFTLTPDPKSGKGKYIAEARGQGGTGKVTVMAEFNGKPMQMGEFTFRLKRIPDPVAKLANKKEGNIGKAVLAEQIGILPSMDNFDFEVKPRVNSYKVVSLGKGRDNLKAENTGGGNISSAVKNVIDKSKNGDRIVFENIMVSMPDGSVRMVNPITLTIQ